MMQNKSKCRVLSLGACAALAAVLAILLPAAPVLASASDAISPEVRDNAKTLSLPSISRLSPNTGPSLGGTEVYIYGSEFSSSGTTRVTFGGADATSIYVNASGYMSPEPYVLCTTPSHAVGDVDVVVVNPDGGTGTIVRGFAYTASPPPTVTSLSVGTGPSLGGSSVSINGTNFFQQGTTRVTFDGMDAAGVYVTDAGKITCKTPPHAAGAVNVTVINPDAQSATLSGGYTYIASPPPTVTAISPAQGTTLGGTEVNVSGAHFGFLGATRVIFGGVDAVNASVSNTGSIYCLAPPRAAAGTVDVVVVNPDGQSVTLSGGYTYTPAPPPAACSAYPMQGITTGGETVYLHGANFGLLGTTRVTFGGIDAANVQVTADDRLTCTTPAHTPAAVDVVVVNPDGQNDTIRDGFFYVLPIVTGASPASGPTVGGLNIMVSGFAFAQSGVRVLFGGVDATGVAVAGEAIHCVLPAHEAGVVDVSVISPDGVTGTLANGFTYHAPGEQVLRVDGNNNSGVEDGTSWATAFTTIQQAVSAVAASGQTGEVWVAGGIYAAATPETVVVTMEPYCDLYGGFAGVETRRDERDIAAHPTVIDGQDESACVYGADFARLDGFTITGGNGPLRLGNQSAWISLFLPLLGSETNTTRMLAVDNSGVSPTLAHCTFTGNTPGFAVVANLTENGNPSSPVITGCDFTGGKGESCAIFNGAQSGLQSKSRIDGCSFTGNYCGILNIGWEGECSPIITRCTLASNAIALEELAALPGICATHAENSVFSRNTNTTLSFLGLSSGAQLRPVFVNCDFTENSATKPIFSAKGGTVQAEMRNCIVWNNSGPLLAADSLATLTASYCSIQNGFAGEGNIAADPLFVDAASGDFRLQAGSPCIDTGAADNAPAADLAGIPRPQGAGFDMGAMEMLVSTMPDLTGYARTAAEEWIAAAKLYVRQETDEYNPTIPNDHVVRHTPPADTVVLSGSPVELVISKGPQPVPVPDVVGKMQNSATGTITEAALAVGTVTLQYSLTVAAGIVISQSIAPETEVLPGTVIDLVVSRGGISVPDVTGQTLDAASALIANAELAVGTVTGQFNAAVPAGVVFVQSLAAGTRVLPGAVVDLLVSKGPQPVAVPGVVGQTQDAAAAVLVNANLTVGTVTQQYSATVPAGTVLSQSPAAGDTVLPGTPVLLVVSRGVQPSVMPDVAGQPRAQAEAAITGAGLALGTATEAYSDTVPTGTVIAQSPSAGTELPPGATVSMVVSLGPASIAEGETEGEVPNAVTAKQELAGAYDSADTNGDGALSFGEASGAVLGLTQTVFDELDTNGDGQLSADELGVNDSTGCAGCQGGKSAVSTGKRLGDLFLTGLGLLGLAATAAVRRL